MRATTKETVVTVIGAAVFFISGCDGPEAGDSAPSATTRASSEAGNLEGKPVDESRSAAPRGAPPTFADLVEQARPAVVNIYTKKRVRTGRYLNLPGGRLIPGERRAQSLGSGFVVDSRFILTNWHVVKEATDIEVRLFDERRFGAEVVGYDPKTDVALLGVQTDDPLPTLEFADSETLRVGDWVVAIGNPLGLTSTVTAGIVSATGRKSLPMGGDMMYQDFIQTDASINPGNSGGPLLDLEGRVVGINTAVHAKGQGLGFAIPINMVREIMDRLEKGGEVERSWLGVYIDPIPSALRKELGVEDGGVLVKRVVRGGPAQKAGIRPGDLMLTFDGETVLGPDELAWMAGNVGVGKEVAVAIRRGSEEQNLTVKLGALPE